MPVFLSAGIFFKKSLPKFEITNVLLRSQSHYNIPTTNHNNTLLQSSILQVGNWVLAWTFELSHCTKSPLDIYLVESGLITTDVFGGRSWVPMLSIPLGNSSIRAGRYQGQWSNWWLSCTDLRMTRFKAGSPQQGIDTGVSRQKSNSKWACTFSSAHILNYWLNSPSPERICSYNVHYLFYSRFLTHILFLSFSDLENSTL